MRRLRKQVPILDEVLGLGCYMRRLRKQVSILDEVSTVTR